MYIRIYTMYIYVHNLCTWLSYQVCRVPMGWTNSNHLPAEMRTPPYRMMVWAESQTNPPPSDPAEFPKWDQITGRNQLSHPHLFKFQRNSETPQNWRKQIKRGFSGFVLGLPRYRVRSGPLVKPFQLSTFLVGSLTARTKHDETLLS